MHHKALMLLCLLAGACGGAPVQREFHQSAMPPGAPAFSAMESAPHTLGQPGYVAREEVPRSPYTRVLPETPETRREAGLWSADVPRAISDEDRAVVNPYLASLRIVLPEDDALMGDFAASSPSRFCSAVVVRHVLRNASLLAKTPLAKESERRCLAAKLLAECLRRVAAEHAAFGDIFTNTTPYALAVLEGKRAAQCPDVTTRAVNPTYSALAATLNVLAREAP